MPSSKPLILRSTSACLEARLLELMASSEFRDVMRDRGGGASSGGGNGSRLGSNGSKAETNGIAAAAAAAAAAATSVPDAGH